MMESSRHIRKILVILECQRGLEWCRFCQAFTQCIRHDRGLSLEHWADLTREVTSCCELRLEEAAEAVRLNEEMYVSLGVGRPIFRYDRAQLTLRHPVYTLVFGGRCREASVRPSMGLSVTPTTTPCARACSLPWNASCWDAAVSRRRPRPGWRSSATSGMVQSRPPPFWHPLSIPIAYEMQMLKETHTT